MLAHHNGMPPGDVTPVWRVLDRRASALRKLALDLAWILAERARQV